MCFPKELTAQGVTMLVAKGITPKGQERKKAGPVVWVCILGFFLLCFFVEVLLGFFVFVFFFFTSPCDFDFTLSFYPNSSTTIPKTSGSPSQSYSGYLQNPRGFVA